MNIIETTPRGKLIPDSKFQFNHGDTIDLAQDHGGNHRSKHKSARKCEPGGHLNEMSVTEMKIYPTGSYKMPEIRYQQPDRTLFRKNDKVLGHMSSTTLHLRALITGILLLVLTGCIASDGGGSGGGGAVSYGTGTASLSWLPPTEYTDGSSIEGLGGYKIYYGTEIGNYTEVITIDNPGVASYMIENLLAGYTYYFVLTSFDADGTESGYSGVGSKTIS